MWSIHSDALGLLLRTRGTSCQFIDPRVGGIARAAVYIAVSSLLSEHTNAKFRSDVPQSDKEGVTGLRSDAL